MNHDVLAALIRRDADRYAQANRSDDPEVRAMIERDVQAMQRVAELVDAGDFRGAYRHAERLDTAARDGFSKRAWKALSGGAAFGHTEHDR